MAIETALHIGSTTQLAPERTSLGIALPPVIFVIGV